MTMYPYFKKPLTRIPQLPIAMLRQASLIDYGTLFPVSLNRVTQCNVPSSHYDCLELAYEIVPI